MEVNELQDLKKKLDQSISAYISDNVSKFEESTGVCLSEIDVNILRLYEGGSRRCIDSKIVVESKIDLRYESK